MTDRPETYPEKHARYLAAFRRVASPTHWKDPIECEITVTDRAELDLIVDAVIYFTATIPDVEQLSETRYRISADGYTMGPAGDH